MMKRMDAEVKDEREHLAQLKRFIEKGVKSVQDAIDVGPGDFFHVSLKTVHRESNPYHRQLLKSFLLAIIRIQGVMMRYNVDTSIRPA
jgi:hypothetical protein